MVLHNGWRERAQEVRARLREATGTVKKRATTASQDFGASLAAGLNATGAVVGEAYSAALKRDNSEFSKWLTHHLSNQRATIASKAMDAEYLRTHIGGGWHRPDQHLGQRVLERPYYYARHAGDYYHR
jgi:hypothetical protein